MEMAVSAACCAAGQESDFHAGALGDLVELPVEVEEELPEVVLSLAVELPTPEEAVPVLLVREELVPVARGLDLSGFDLDWPEPLPVPLGLLVWVSVFRPRAALVEVSVVLPAPGRGSSSPPG